VGATTNPVHHYTIEVYALDTTIDVQASNDAQETRARVFQAMSGHVVGKGFLPGRSALPAAAK
jgi:phosphatidylethanolamine-binding protein (PEBP) family uncharacterized protein